MIGVGEDEKAYWLTEVRLAVPYAPPIAGGWKLEAGPVDMATTTC